MSKGVIKKSARLRSFSLVELLVVILIIAILAGLTLAAGEGVMNQAARSRAKSEMAAIAAALESYKVDNGAYPWTNVYNYTPIFNSPADFSNPSYDPSLGASSPYQVSAQILYEALSGKTNSEDVPVAGIKTYMNFKAGQLGNTSTAAGSGYSAASSTYIQDPFGYAYGYYANAAASAPPTNGAGMYDLWTSAGTTSTAANWTNSWISNWAQ